MFLHFLFILLLQEAYSKPTATCWKTRTTPVIDGNLDDWGYCQSNINLTHEYNKTDIDTLAQANYSFMYDDTYFYFAAFVQDHKIFAYSNQSYLDAIYADDGFELMIAPFNDNDNRTSLGPADCHFMVNLIGAHKNSVGAFFDANIRYSINGTLNDNTDMDYWYITEGSVTWSSMNITPPVDKQMFGFGLLGDNRWDILNDNSGQKYWEAPLLSYRDTSNWNKMIFIDVACVNGTKSPPFVCINDNWELANITEESSISNQIQDVNYPVVVASDLSLNTSTLLIRNDLTVNTGSIVKVVNSSITIEGNMVVDKDSRLTITISPNITTAIFSVANCSYLNGNIYLNLTEEFKRNLSTIYLFNSTCIKGTPEIILNNNQLEECSQIYSSTNQTFGLSVSFNTRNTCNSTWIIALSIGIVILVVAALLITWRIKVFYDRRRKKIQEGF